MRTERKEKLRELETILGKLPEKDAGRAKELLSELTTVHVAAIAQVSDGTDLYATLLCAATDGELLDKVLGYFRDEEEEDHPVQGTDFSDIREADGWEGIDDSGERQYHITAAAIRP